MDHLICHRCDEAIVDIDDGGEHEDTAGGRCWLHHACVVDEHLVPFDELVGV
jgi:hypothetical protein